MKILQLCKKFPYPLKDGESIAVSFMSKALSELGCEITLLSMNTSKHHFEIDQLPAHYGHYKSIHTVDVDNRVKIWDAFKNLFSTSSYHVSRFVSTDYENELAKLLQENEYDVIQLETLYLTPYIPTIKKYSKAIISYRAHNVESKIWNQITNNTSFLPKKLYINHLTKKLTNYETDHLKDYDYLISVSDYDLRLFKKMGYKNGAMTSPIGLAIKDYKYKERRSESRDICFIGSLDWLPNLEGLEWFINDVFPLVRDAHPSIKLHIAGRNSSKAMKNLMAEGLQLYGEVPSAIEFINQHRIMIVPLLSGSGTRVKILEGLALGIPIITTSTGLEGIPAKHGQHLMIADTPEEFDSCISQLLDDENLCQQLSREGRAFVTNHYDNLALAAKLIAKYQELKTTYS